jgi:hypothetical protein
MSDTQTYRQRHADTFYLKQDWFGPDESYLECVKTSIITTRNEHLCMFPDSDQHIIPRGSRAFKESAKVDGQFQTNYCCLKCLDDWAEQEKRG